MSSVMKAETSPLILQVAETYSSFFVFIITYLFILFCFSNMVKRITESAKKMSQKHYVPYINFFFFS